MNDGLDDLLTKIGDRMGLSGLAWDEGGECTLLFDDRIGVNLSMDAGSEALVMYGIVGQVAPSERASIYPLLLNANLFWKDTAGATLGTDVATGTVVLAQSTPLAGLSVDATVKRLELFVSLVASWTKQLAGEKQVAQEDGGSSLRSGFGPNSFLRA